MPRPIWSGSIGFGLVNVPIKLTTATRSQDVRFHQLDASTDSRIRYRKVAEATGEEVPPDQIRKAYEISSGQYVVVEDDEMQALAPKASRIIEIEDFVDLDQIDPIYFNQPYYLVPDKTGAKPYRLLVDAMRELQKVAIGRIVLRSKEHLVAIRPRGDLLCLETMRYADEVVPEDGVEGVPEDGEEPTDRELAMARQLVESLGAEFEPAKYHDQYREELIGLIERKAAGEEIVAEPMVEEPAKVVDLMAALEASLARSGGGDSAEGGTRKAASRKPAKRSSTKKTSTTKKPAKRAKKPTSKTARKSA